MHATRDTLQKFATGRLSRADAAGIEAHLLECPECGLLFDELDLSGDHLVGLLRRGDLPPVSDVRLISNSVSLQLSAPSASAANSPAVERFAPGAGFGRYRIQRPLGQGGMGIVYEALDTVLHRHVALKVIDPHRIIRDEERVRFRREAESAAQLQHANIVQIYDFGELDGTLYCAFELVVGGNLAQRLSDGPLPLHEAARITATLADAVQYAHQRQIIHRDLKPANVLFTADGTPKIADFGLAKRLDDEVAQTVDGALLGSPAYMSPEQAVGKMALICPATDVYALGAVLYELLVGRPPFQGVGVMATLDLVKHAPPPPLARLRPDVDRDLETICLKCLEKQPNHRYSRAADLAADLRRFLDGMPIKARPSNWLERSAKLARRHPWATGFSSVFALLLAAFAMTVAVYNVRLRGALEETENYAKRLQGSLDDAERNLFALQLQRAAMVAGTNSDQAQRLLQDEEICRVELRDFCWGHLLASCRRELQHWDNGGEVRSLAVSPDGTQFVTGDEAGVIRVWSFDTDVAVRTFAAAHPGAVTSIAFSADGKQLATVSDDGTSEDPADEQATPKGAAAATHGTVKLWDWPAMQSPTMIAPGRGRINCVAYTPRGGQFVTAHSDGVVRVWNGYAAQPAAELPAHEASVLRIAFSADGRRLASGSRDGAIRVWNAETWALASETRGFGTEVRFHPERAAVLAMGNSNYGLQLWSIGANDSLVPDRVFRNFGEKISQIAFSPGGDWIAAAGYDGMTRVFDPSTGDEVLLSQAGSKVSAVAFSDENRLLTGTRDGKIQQWKLVTTVKPMEIDAHGQRSVTGLVFLSDDTTLVSGGAGGEVRAWNTADGSNIAEWIGPGTSVTGLAATADRTQFAWEAGGTLYVGRLDSRTLQDTPVPSEPLFVSALALSRGGDVLAVVDFLGVRLLNSHAGSEFWNWADHPITSVAASPVADQFAAADDSGEVWIVDPAVKQVRPLAQLPSAVTCLAYDTTGGKLIVGMANGDAIVFDADSGDERIRLRGHTHAVHCTAYSPDGKTIATGSIDGEVRLWDSVAGPERAVLRTLHAVLALTFSPNSKTLAAAGNDGMIRVWKSAAP